MQESAINAEGRTLSDYEYRAAQTRLIMNLFQLWQLDQESQLNLLDQSPKSRTLITKYCKGAGVLPRGRDLSKRVGLLLSIHKSLPLLFPEDKEIQQNWIHQRNKLLDNYTPLEVMTEQGLFGIAKVARFPDFYRGQ